MRMLAIRMRYFRERFKFWGLRGSRGVFFYILRERRQEGRDDFEYAVVLVLVVIGTALEDPDLVVSPSTRLRLTVFFG